MSDGGASAPVSISVIGCGYLELGPAATHRVPGRRRAPEIEPETPRPTKD